MIDNYKELKDVVPKIIQKTKKDKKFSQLLFVEPLRALITLFFIFGFCTRFKVLFES